MTAPESAQKPASPSVSKRLYRWLIDRDGAWAFFNSAVGMWLLGTVLVGALAAGYSGFNNDRKTRHQNQLKADRIKLELLNRVREWHLRGQSEVVQHEFSQKDFDAYFRILLAPPNPERGLSAIHSEFSQMGFLPLLTEYFEATNGVHIEEAKFVKNYVTDSYRDSLGPLGAPFDMKVDEVNEVIMLKLRDLFGREEERRHRRFWY